MTLIACVAIGVAGALLVTAAAAPRYSATSRLLLSTHTKGDTAYDLSEGDTFARSRIATYATLATTDSVLAAAAGTLGLSGPGDIRGDVKATSAPDTVTLSVDAEAGTPRAAAQIANAVARSLSRTAATIEPSTVRLSIVDFAQPPTSNFSPNKKLNVALGLLLGLGLGVSAILLRTAFDRRVRTAEDAQALTEAPMLGVIPYMRSARSEPLALVKQPGGPLAEAYRQLRTGLEFADVGGPSRCILVTSGLAGEGKSSTSINLALALRQAGRSVVVVDADLRRPQVAAYLDLRRDLGLTSVLVGRYALQEVVQEGPQGLLVIGTGPLPPNPSELVGSPAMERLLGELRQRFEFVIIDTTPLLPVTDALALSPYADGVLLVVGSRIARKDALRRCFELLDNVGARLIGIVVTRVPLKGPEAPGYYGDSYASPAAGEYMDVAAREPV